MTVLEIDRVSKTYGSGAEAFTAIDEISFTASPGELLCIVGPSGCGKTTLLRCVSGLMAPTSGAVHLDERTVTAPPRSMALVFQDYSRSLLPWMSVHDNVVPIRYGERLFALIRAPKRFVRLANAGHNDHDAHGGFEAVQSFLVTGPAGPAGLQVPLLR